MNSNLKANRMISMVSNIHYITDGFVSRTLKSEFKSKTAFIAKQRTDEESPTVTVVTSGMLAGLVSARLGPLIPSWGQVGEHSPVPGRGGRSRSGSDLLESLAGRMTKDNLAACDCESGA